MELILESPPALTPVILWLDRLPKRLQNATYAAFELEGGPLAVRKLREQFSKKDLIARGDTWRDWDYRVKRSGVEGVLLDVFNYQPDIVLLVIEKGRRKRRKAPPPEAILEWMDVRNIRPSDGETEEALAFLIGRKIAREGIPGRHPIEDAREDLRRRTDLSRVIGSYIDKEIAAL